MLKLDSFHIQAHLIAFLQILAYFSQICLGLLARESPCSTDHEARVVFSTPLLPRPCWAQIFSLTTSYSQRPLAYVPTFVWETKFRTHTK